MKLLLLPLLILAALAPSSRGEIRYVIAVSIDGGRGDFIQTFIDTAPLEFPNFKRLRDMGASTFNARCDYSHSITIPDHLSMMTGRPVSATGGVPLAATHGVTSDAPSASATVHVYLAADGVNSGPYKASIFDVVHDRGKSTALFMGKNRLAICNRSWDATNGAADITGVDNGKNKLDVSVQVEASGNAAATPGMLATLVASIQNTTLKNFTFFHIADTDYSGHSGGWSTAAGGYRTTMSTADGWLGQILDAVQNNAALAGKVAIMLTADHGGGGTTPNNSHTDATLQGNYTIPFFLAAPGIAAGSDLHAVFANRFNPGAARPTYADPAQPMRNGDVANLSAALLGVPPVAGSLMGPEFKKPLTEVRAGNIITVSWPLYLTGYTLEYTDDLVAPVWTPVTAGIVETATEKTYTFNFPPPDRRYFRLHLTAN